VLAILASNSANNKSYEASQLTPETRRTSLFGLGIRRANPAADSYDLSLVGVPRPGRRFVDWCHHDVQVRMLIERKP
jgi:hypothetical protein